MASTVATARITYPKRTAITTTLYDLIEAINTEVAPDEDELVTATVVHMLNSGRVKFLGDLKDHKVICA
jgi:hypothetical protein